MTPSEPISVPLGSIVATPAVLEALTRGAQSASRSLQLLGLGMNEMSSKTPYEASPQANADARVLARNGSVVTGYRDATASGGPTTPLWSVHAPLRHPVRSCKGPVRCVTDRWEWPTPQ
jgi:hypothetical protein